MQLHDLCECHSYTDESGRRIERHVSTVYWNLPYSLQKAKKRLAETDSKYPKGTFFVITKNGNKPILNKHLKPKTNGQHKYSHSSINSNTLLNPDSVVLNKETTT